MPNDLHVPSIDMLFKSLAEHAPPGAAAILTGMGHDGVEGLGALRRRGWSTFAQDEASSVVYGMPRAAVESGAAEQTLPLNAIGGALARSVGRRGTA
jgi:chemotaxis response regulator CheB